MSRLAAYYQEDFTYPSISQFPHQKRGATYEYYPDSAPYDHAFNGYRIRNLATSEPSLVHQNLYPVKQRQVVLENQYQRNINQHESRHFQDDPMSYRIDGTTAQHQLRNRGHFVTNGYPHYVQNEHIDNLAGRHLNVRNGHSSLDSTGRDSGLAFNERLVFERQYVPKSKSASKERQRRLSFVEENGIDPNMLRQGPEMYISKDYLKYHLSPRYADDSDFFSFDSRISPQGGSLSPPEIRHAWAFYQSNAPLSPPSPLDSGLSSQSIASSPSLDTDPSAWDWRFNCDPISNARQRLCNCPKIAYPEHVTLINNHNHRPKSKKTKPQARELDEDNELQPVRYGKLGIVGESTDSDHTIVASPKRSSRRERDSMRTSHNGRLHTWKSQTRRDLSKSHLTVTVTSESGTTESSPSPEHTAKSPDSSLSVAVSDSPSDGSYNSSNGIDIQSCKASYTKTSSSSDVNSPHSQRKSFKILKDKNCHKTSNDHSSVNTDKQSYKLLDRQSKKKREKAIRELEDMYHRCNLEDQDLLDRAERRDLPIEHQIKSNLKRSKSDTLYETMSPRSLFQSPYENQQRAPPARRSGIPDRVYDDMALRKQYKPSTPRPLLPDKTISYMLCSTQFTPSVPSHRDFLLENCPDVEFDDLSYRTHYLRKKSTIPDPQPPFGIPLKPLPLKKDFNDYLHAMPSDEPQPLCHPRVNPDVVRDDLAFRALRKDEPERAYYDMAQMYSKK